MLPKNLLRSSEDGKNIYPLYIKDTPRILEEINNVLDIFRNSADLTYASLLEDISDLTSTSQRHRFLKGLCHILEGRLSFYEIPGEISPEDLREKLFRMRAALREDELCLPDWREKIISKLAKDLDCTSAMLEELIYCDLREQRKILAFQDLEESELISAYNLSLAQTLLFRAKSLRVSVQIEEENSALVLRKLFSSMKFFGLLFEVKPNEDLYEFELDGPNALLSQAQKYGFQLASFLPQLYHFKNWSAEAEILTDTGGKRIFNLSPNDFSYPYRPFATRLSDESQRLAARIEEIAPDWVCDSQAPILRLRGQSIWIPDFCVMHKKSKKKAYIEVLGFWRSDYLKRRLRYLKSDAPKNLILIVSDKLKIDKEELIASHERVVFYKTTPRAASIVKLIEECAS